MIDHQLVGNADLSTMLRFDRDDLEARICVKVWDDDNPTQAKRGLEWATPPCYRLSHLKADVGHPPGRLIRLKHFRLFPHLSPAS